MAKLALAFDIMARDKGASRTLAKVGDSATAAGKKIEDSGRRASGFGNAMKAGLAVAAGGIAVLGKNAIQAGANFDSTLRQMAAVADVPAAGIKQLSTLALKMGADTKYSAQEAADAMLELAKGGISAAQIEAGVLKETLTLAAAGGLGLANAAGYMSNALNSFKLEAKDAGGVAAALAGGANASTASVESLGMGLAQVGSGAVNAGLSLQETVAALAIFESAGIKGSDAGTSLKTMLAALVPTTDKAEGAMDDLGLKFTDAQGSFLPLAQVAGQLQEKLGGLSEEQRTLAMKTIFGSDATRAASELMRAGAGGVQKYTAATSNLGAANKVAGASMEGVKGAMERASGAIDTAKTQLGMALAPAVERVANFVGDVLVPALTRFGKYVASDIMPRLREFGSWLNEHIVPALKKMGEFVLRNKDFFVPFVAILGTIIAAIKVWTIVQAALNVVLAMNPISLIVIGVAALAAGLVMAYRKSETFKRVVDQGFRVVLAVWNIVWPVLKKGLELWWAWIKKVAAVVSWLWSSVWKPTLKFLVNAWLTAVGAIISAAAKAFGWVPGIGPKLRAAAKEFGKLRDEANRALNGIKDEPVNVKIGVTAVDHARDRALASRNPSRGGDGYGIGGTGDGYGIARSGGLRLNVSKSGSGLEDAQGIASKRASEIARALEKKYAAQPGMGYRRMMNVLRMQFPGLPLISGYRPGAITATGNPSYHGKGRAVDIPPSMAVFNYIRSAFGKITKELIFSPAGGRQIHNGRPHMYTGITRANHWDHVHWAMANGGVINEPVLGRGMHSGKSYAFGEKGPETVTPGRPGGGPIELGEQSLQRLAALILAGAAQVTDRKLTMTADAYAYGTV